MCFETDPSTGSLYWNSLTLENFAASKWIPFTIMRNNSRELRSESESDNLINGIDLKRSGEE